MYRQKALAHRETSKEVQGSQGVWVSSLNGLQAEDESYLK